MSTVIRSPNWIGDGIMCLPAIRAHKELFPQERLSLAVKRYLADIFLNLPEIDEIIPIPDRWTAAAYLAGLKNFRARHFDRGILFTNSFSSALFFRLAGISSLSVKGEFLQHAIEEQAHADQLAERIVQLGGEPNLSPEGLLSRSHSEYVEGDSLVEMITEDLIAERIAIDSYREMLTYVGTDDPTTRKVLEGILAQEEEHAEDLASLLKELGPHAHEPVGSL